MDKTVRINDFQRSEEIIFDNLSEVDCEFGGLELKGVVNHARHLSSAPLKIHGMPLSLINDKAQLRTK